VSLAKIASGLFAQQTQTGQIEGCWCGGESERNARHSAQRPITD